PLLERSTGVGEVRIVGGLPRSINVWVDADRLAAYQLPITSVRDALVRQNADLPGGNVTSGPNEASLGTMGRMADPKAFNDLVVANLGGSPVRVRDIGYAEDGTKEMRSAARLNGVPTVILEIRRQSGENTVAVIEGVKKSLERLAPQVPPDVKLEIIRDQSKYIYAALHEINLHLVLGSILASLVALDVHCRRRHPDLGHLGIRHDVDAEFHAEQRDHAGAGADGRYRHRRRDRRAGERVPLRGREEDAAVRGRPRGHRGHRARR